MKKNSKNKLILMAVTALCFWVAAERINDWYKINVSVGSVGDCFSIHYPNTDVKYRLRILSNVPEQNFSDVAISTLENPDDEWLDEFSYSQIRSLEPNKMECK